MQAINTETEKPKPHVERVILGDGTVKLYGVSAAARWLGCSQNSLSQVARGMPGRGERLAKRARVEFPGLFGQADVPAGSGE